MLASSGVVIFTLAICKQINKLADPHTCAAIKMRDVTTKATTRLLCTRTTFSQSLMLTVGVSQFDYTLV